MTSSFNYISYMALLKELFGANITRPISEVEFSKMCLKKFNVSILKENLNFFRKDRNSISL